MRKKGNSWITTHQGPNGDFYTIKNSDPAEADMTLYNEDKRNERLKNAVANGLYRFNSLGYPIRPAGSSEEFRQTVADAGAQDDFGNYDMGSVKETDEGIVKGPLGGFISYGTGENGSNQMAAIDERSASIVLSYEARDKAIAEGKTLEEAKEIGAEVYNKQEAFRRTSLVSPDQNVQPEDHPTGGSSETPDSTTPPEEDDEDSEQRESRFTTAKNFMNRVGRSILIGGSVALKATGHSLHIVGDEVGKVGKVVGKETWGYMKTVGSEAWGDAKTAGGEFKDIGEFLGENVPKTAKAALELMKKMQRESLIFKDIITSGNDVGIERVRETLNNTLNLLFESNRDDETLDYKRTQRLSKMINKEWQRSEEELDALEASMWARALLKKIAERRKSYRQYLNRVKRDEKAGIREAKRDAKTAIRDNERDEDSLRIKELLKGIRAYHATKHPGDTRYTD